MVLHDQQIDITSEINNLDQRISDLGFPPHAIHVGPIIRKESIVEGYGEIPFPDGPYIPNNSRTLRSEFTPAYKMEFKEWWINQGREWPNGNVNIHHIKPLSKGGTNSFENLVPLIQPKEHQPFTNWWRYYP